MFDKLEHILTRLTKEDGILDEGDHEVLHYKLTRINDYYQEISFNQVSSFYTPIFNDNNQAINEHFKKIVNCTSIGKITKTENVEALREILHYLKSYFRALDLSIELSSGKFYNIEESYSAEMEPFIDPEDGQVYWGHYSNINPTIICNYESYSVKYNLYEPVYDEGESNDIDQLTNKLEDLQISQRKWNNFHNEFSGSLNETFHKFVNDFRNINQSFYTNLMIDLDYSIVGYTNANLAEQVQSQEMQKAMSFYFDPINQRQTPKIAKLVADLSNSQGNREVTTDLNAGEVIIGTAEYLRSKYLLNENLSAYEQSFKWNNIDIAIRRMASRYNIGNLVIKNIGAYGQRDIGTNSKKGVLEDFQEIISYSGLYNFLLVLENYGYKPFEINLNHLNLPSTKVGRDLLAKFQKDLFLIYCAEIFRYFPIEGMEHCRETKKIPFAIALGIGLELLQEESIDITDLFEKDAALGLPTGTGILDSTKAVKNKLRDLMQKKEESLKSDYPAANNFLVSFPKGRLVENADTYLEILKNTFGNNLRENRQRLNT